MAKNAQDILQDFAEAGDGMSVVILPPCVICDAQTADALLAALERSRPTAIVFAPEYVPEAAVRGRSAYFAPERCYATETYQVAPGSRIYASTSSEVRMAFEATSTEAAQTQEQ